MELFVSRKTEEIHFDEKNTQNGVQRTFARR